MKEVLLPVLLLACVAVLHSFCDVAISNDTGNESNKGAELSASFLLSSTLTASILPTHSKNTARCSDFILRCDSYDDEACVGKSIVSYLRITSKGVPDCNALAIDPFTSPSIEVIFAEEGVVYVNNNVKLTGLAEQRIVDFKVNTTEKSVVLTTIADINLVSDVNVYFSTLPQILKGSYNCYATITGTIKYNYDYITDDEGVEHKKINPETITVNVVNTPLVKLNPELEAIVLNEPDVKAILCPEMKGKFRVQTIREIAGKAYTNMIHNLMEVVKLIPASAFFKKY